MNKRTTEWNASANNKYLLIIVVKISLCCRLSPTISALLFLPPVAVYYWAPLLVTVASVSVHARVCVSGKHVGIEMYNKCFSLPFESIITQRTARTHSIDESNEY